jgi:hypothetical protein
MSDLTQIENEEESIKLHDLIPDELVGFNTVVDYLPCSIGLYNKFLPRYYFTDLFKRCKSLGIDKSEIPQDACFHAYRGKLLNLKNSIIDTLGRYKQQVKETDLLDGKNENNFFKEEHYGILDKLLMMDESVEEGDSQHFIIKYFTTDPHPNFTEKHFIIDHIDKDVLDLVTLLYDLSLFSPNDKKYFDSYKLFCENIIVHMRANHEVEYPKSIINYTCFMYNIPGYPYLTPSKRIYSINNYSRSIENKFDNVVIYMKNTDALISYLYDITFDETIDQVLQREWILRTAYCLCIALLAYRSEFVEYQTVTHNLFET